jgi:hypothetical protein
MVPTGYQDQGWRGSGWRLRRESLGLRDATLGSSAVTVSEVHSVASTEHLPVQPPNPLSGI